MFWPQVNWVCERATELTKWILGSANRTLAGARRSPWTCGRWPGGRDVSSRPADGSGTADLCCSIDATPFEFVVDWFLKRNTIWVTFREGHASEGLTLRPAQINFHMQSTGRLQVHPEVRLFLFVTCYQILKLYCGIGIEVIIDWCYALGREHYSFSIGKPSWTRVSPLWKMVMPKVLAFSTSWMNVSFQTGSNVFCLMLDRSARHGRWRDRQ